MNLYLRLLKFLLMLPFVQGRRLLDSGRIAFRVWPNDCDINLHLNNGRYLTFMLTTRLLSWDEKYFYMEQRFEAGDRLCAVALVKGLFLHRRERVQSHAILAALHLNDMSAPAMPETVRHWNDLGALKKQQSG